MAIAWLSLLGAPAAWAKTYTLPTTSGPFSGCTVSGSDESCPGNLVIGNSVTVVLASGTAKPIQLSIGGDFTFGNNFSLNAGGNPDDIDVSVTNNLNPGNNAVLNANLTVGGSVNVGNNAGLQGNLVIGGNLNLGNNSSIQGNVQVDGALNIGNNITISGDVNAQSVVIGNNTTIDGNVTAADTVIIGSGSTVTGDVTAPHITSSGTIDGNKYCDDYNGQTSPCNGPPGPQIDHFQLSFTNQEALTCQPATVTIQACGDSGCTAGALYTGTVTATLSPSGWVGGDTITFSGGSTTAQLSHTTAGTVTLGVASSSPAAANPTLCFLGATQAPCQITFKDSGFVFDVPDHAAGTTQAVTISAVAKDDATKKCIPAFQNVVKTVSFWSTYLNPASGTQALNVNGTDIAGASPGTPLSLTFDSNGDSSLQVRYPDVGQMQLDALYQGSGPDAGLTMTGQDGFVVRPDHFDLTNITCADNTLNPGATDANGPAFCRAGQAFKVTVSARNAADAVTPNYGRESSPESVALTTSLVAPAGGADPGLNGGFGSFGQDCSGNPAPGTACGTFDWPQVGIITLTPRVADSDYLGAGNVTGTASGNVGRFFPARFAVAVSPAAPSFADGCTSGANPFTYFGQSFGFTTTPTITVTAQDMGGTPTTNYDCGGFWKLGSDLAYDYSDPTQPASAPLTATPGPPRTFTGTADCNGWASITLDDSFSYQRPPTASPIAPYRPSVAFTIDQSDLTDSDTVCYEPGGVCSGFQLTGITFSSPSGTLRHGRIKVFDNFGPDKEDITDSPFVIQYYNGTGWVTNSDDECTGPADVSFCPSARIKPGSVQLSGGQGTLTVTGGPAGENLSVCGVGPAWLTDLPDCSVPDATCGTFTFGIYRGNDRIINWQEIQ